MKLRDLVQKIGAKIINTHGLNEDVTITGVAPLNTASPSEISFLTHARYREQVMQSQAAAIIVREIEQDCPSIQLLHPNPQEAMAIASLSFFSYKHHFQGQSTQAFVHDDAHIDANVTLYPFAYVDAGASIGANTIIYPHTYIGANAKIGSNCILFPGVVIMSDVSIANNVTIHPNAVIGADGFGFAAGKNGILKIPQTGNVVIENDVEIGSLSNIDRATFDKTHIGRSTKIDSLVQIGHNVQVGDYSLLCAQFGAGGSSKIGKRFLAGGQSAVTMGVSIGDGVTIGGRCAVTRDLGDGGSYHGLPVRPAREWLRDMTNIKNLPDLMKRIKKLEERLEMLNHTTSSHDDS